MIYTYLHVNLHRICFLLKKLKYEKNFKLKYVLPFLDSVTIVIFSPYDYDGVTNCAIRPFDSFNTKIYNVTSVPNIPYVP